MVGGGGGFQKNRLHARVAHRTQDANSKKNDIISPFCKEVGKKGSEGRGAVPKNPGWVGAGGWGGEGRGVGFRKISYKPE